MHPKRAHVFVVFLAVALVVPLATAGATAGVAPTEGPTAGATLDATAGSQPAGAALESADAPSIALQPDDRPDDPTTEDTIGYVAGYWYDDSLPVDDREGAHVSDEELEAVVYRSMARVETIRERTFETTPEVEVITREEFQNETDELFGNTTEREELLENVRYEGLMMVERDRDAVATYQQLYGGAVAGYYEPGTDEIVLISDDLEEVEVDENTLGHELVHALQDQRFGLEDFDRSTMNRDGAVNGLVEGDATFVDEQYTERCNAEWECLEPESNPPGLGDVPGGMYFSLQMPYMKGPGFIEHIYENGGWDAVDARYDDPPASTSEIIRPGEDRDPVEIDLDDRSTDEWEPLTVDGNITRPTMGEGVMVSMFADGTLKRSEPSVISTREFFTAGAGGRIEDIHYDQPITDGWAGDEMVVYTDGAETVDESGFVWQTEWTSADEASEFRDGYLDLLSLHDAEPVDGHRNTLEIDADYPGSYYVEQDGETVTIVRAPSTDELPEIREGAAPEGDHTIEHAVFGTADGQDDGNGSDDGDDETSAGNAIPGFGVVAALIALLAVGLGRR